MLPEAGFLYEAARSEASPGGKVAIILRTRDRPILLRRALRDIIAQTYTEWHIQLVNDGGNADVVQTIVEEQAADLAGRVTLHHNRTSVDRPAALNQGLAHASGAYFVVHDDDDTWDKVFLSATVGLLSEPQNAALIGAITLYSRVQEHIEGDAIIQDSCYPIRLSDDFADITRQWVLNRLTPIGVLFRMSLLNQIGMFNPDMRVAEDWEFSVRALLVGDFGVVRQPLAYHHVRPETSNLAYNNSIVTDGGQLYKRHSMLARNHLVRRAIAERPELLGIVQPLMHAIYDNVDYACRRMAHEHKSQADQIYAAAKLMTDQHADFAVRLSNIECEIGELRQALNQIASALSPRTAPTAA